MLFPYTTLFRSSFAADLYNEWTAAAWSLPARTVRKKSETGFSCAYFASRLPIASMQFQWRPFPCPDEKMRRSEEHTSELQSLMRNSYAVFCLKNKIH